MVNLPNMQNMNNPYSQYAMNQQMQQYQQTMQRLAQQQQQLQQLQQFQQMQQQQNTKQDSLYCRFIMKENDIDDSEVPIDGTISVFPTMSFDNVYIKWRDVKDGSIKTILYNNSEKAKEQTQVVEKEEVVDTEKREEFARGLQSAINGMSQVLSALGNEIEARFNNIDETIGRIDKALL